MKNNDRQIEETLLLKSHSKERTKELLETRYSYSGEQKPLLVLTPTTGPTAATTTKFGTKQLHTTISHSKINNKSKFNKSKLHNARIALNDYIKGCKRNQQLLKSCLKLSDKSNPLLNQKCDELSKKIPTYDQFVPLHRLWRSYITDLLFSTVSPTQTQTPVKTLQNAVGLASKLATADFHGAQVTVVSARNPTLVGMQGIVIWEAKSSFIIVLQSPVLVPCSGFVGGIRIIEKKGTRFKVTVYTNELDQIGHEFELIGSRFLYRTADRSGRKFKPRSVDDL